MANLNEEQIMAAADAAIGFGDGNFLGTSDDFASYLGWVEYSREFVPPYWSPMRDRRLRQFWKQIGSGHLSSTIYNAQAKLAAIPVTVVPRDPTIVSHMQEAEQVQMALQQLSEFGMGLNVAMEKWFEDYLGTDNGAFLEVIGGPADTNKSGPLRGRPVAVRHLDSLRCQRTSDPVYPVLYLGDDNKKHKLHFSRIISSVQMPSSDKRLNGVGYCSTSRAIDFAQSLHDLTIYKREKLGSRPNRKLMVGKGFAAKDIMQAFRLADLQAENSDASPGSLFVRNVALGTDNEKANIDVIDLLSMDEFQESVFVPYAMYGIALAFGIPADELWPEASKTDDNALAHMRARGKLPAQVTQALEREFNTKFVPPHLRVRWDWVDDAQDKEQAIIRDIRARNRERNIFSSSTTYEVERRIMLRDGDISKQEYADMELADGRLADGSPVETLFYSSDEYISMLLATNVEAPFATMLHDPNDMIAEAQIIKNRIYAELGKQTSSTKRDKCQLALAAVNKLEMVYRNQEPVDADSNIPDSSAMGPRFRQRAAGTRTANNGTGQN